MQCLSCEQEFDPKPWESNICPDCEPFWGYTHPDPDELRHEYVTRPRHTPDKKDSQDARKREEAHAEALYNHT